MRKWWPQIFAVSYSEKMTWTHCRDIREVWHVAPSCWNKIPRPSSSVSWAQNSSKCSCKLLCWQSCQKISVQWCASLTQHTKHQFSDPRVAAHARLEGSPQHNTVCSANLRGWRDKTTPHHSLCTGMGLTGLCRCYSEATFSNLFVSQC
jgi:hypothetical protein